jgi:hypothetical protein
MKNIYLKNQKKIYKDMIILNVVIVENQLSHFEMEKSKCHFIMI